MEKQRDSYSHRCIRNEKNDVGNLQIRHFYSQLRKISLQQQVQPRKKRSMLKTSNPILRKALIGILIFAIAI